MALLFSFQSFANIHQAPPSLDLGRNAKGVFIDFKVSKSHLTYDIAKRQAFVKSTIIFEQNKTGKPVFDLVPNPVQLVINGEIVLSGVTSMNGISTVRYLDKIIGPGTHTLEVTNEITKNISWSSDYVKSGFWMSDLSDRRYLEQYLPTNLEYDQYQNEFEVKIINTDSEHVLYTNGTSRELSKNHWSITYPDTYTASSIFYHMTKKDLIPETKSIYKSIDGRSIPVTVYTTQGKGRFMHATLRILAELEQDYGPWPHQQVIIYGAGSGGMEYCGATITSFSALGHELTHSYFARGIMPAHGNSGWVDEAIASWRDGGYRSYSESSLSRTRMAGHSVYQRTTDRNAYSKGMRFIGFLHKKFEGKESFKIFLKSFFETKKFKPFKTHEFQSAVESYYNTSLGDEFDTYIYGKKGVEETKGPHKENIHHPRLTEKQLLDLL